MLFMEFNYFEFSQLTPSYLIKLITFFQTHIILEHRCEKEVVNPDTPLLTFL